MRRDSGGDRAGSVQALCDVDVVLTTYGIVSSEYSRAVRDGGSPNGDAAGDPGDGMAVEPVSRDLSGTIFGVRFHRVVLDEAHMIKSRTTNVARGGPRPRPWTSARPPGADRTPRTVGTAPTRAVVVPAGRFLSLSLSVRASHGVRFSLLRPQEFAPMGGYMDAGAEPARGFVLAALFSPLAALGALLRVAPVHRCALRKVRIALCPARTRTEAPRCSRRWWVGPVWGRDHPFSTGRIHRAWPPCGPCSNRSFFAAQRTFEVSRPPPLASGVRAALAC